MTKAKEGQNYSDQSPLDKYGKLLYNNSIKTA